MPEVYLPTQGPRPNGTAPLWDAALNKLLSATIHYAFGRAFNVMRFPFRDLLHSTSFIYPLAVQKWYCVHRLVKLARNSILSHKIYHKLAEGSVRTIATALNFTPDIRFLN
ncbi:hypothetical protein O181_020246 [Austropuccinia psidii MF-1]|uniref:Uncharacterized protein n=1 Tax=Austropuccinia psidii MF-1 TaxID=1389203 RepID=A0A9Q3CD38_9BASI|nr:hypothetical protein [Austropuccinia psidii MF-1]